MNIEYFDDTHTYVVDGIVVPSVSELVAFATGNIYDNIPSSILERARLYGTAVHDAIEEFENDVYVEHVDEVADAVNKWFHLKLDNKITVLEMEQMVATKDYAGRYDILATVDGNVTLLDIKTTSQYHPLNLSVQMGLYTHALGADIPCACIWLPKNGEAKYIPVTPITNDECEELVKAYKSHTEPPTLTKAVEGISIYTPEETAKIKAFYALKSEVEKIDKVAKERAISYMEENGVKSFDDGEFKITYIPPTTKKVVDSDALKLAGLYDEYSKETPVKASVRITWRKAKEL